MVIWTALYPFWNNPIDAVEELTMGDLAPILSYRGDSREDIESWLSKYELMGGDADEELIDALENIGAEDINITSTKKGSMRIRGEDKFKSDVYSVRLKFNDAKKVKYEFEFIVADKGYMRVPPYSYVITVDSMRDSLRGDYISGRGRRGTGGYLVKPFFISLYMGCEEAFSQECGTIDSIDKLIKYFSG